MVRGSREIARFSYTLYAAHTPILVLFASLVVGDSRWQPTARTFFYAIAVLAVAMLYAYLLAFFTEFRTDALRMSLERLFGWHAKAPILPSNPLADAKTSPSA